MKGNNHHGPDYRASEAICAREAAESVGSNSESDCCPPRRYNVFQLSVEECIEKLKGNLKRTIEREGFIVLAQSERKH